MKSLFRFLLLTLVLLVVALVSALTAMRFAIHGREVEVPNLVGKSPTEARRIADAEGFDMVVERRYYSASVPEGRILSQVPAARTLVRRGWQIRVAASLGPQRVQIPSVLGQSERAAEMNIRRRGLDVGTVALMQAPGTADQVLSQSPPPNASDISAPKISLLVAQSAAPQAYLMPNLIGQRVANARLVLQNAGLRLGNVNQTPAAAGSPPESTGTSPSENSAPTPAQATGVIVSQNPAPGAKVVAGTAVSFEVR